MKTDSIEWLIPPPKFNFKVGVFNSMNPYEDDFYKCDEPLIDLEVYFKINGKTYFILFDVLEGGVLLKEAECDEVPMSEFESYKLLFEILSYCECFHSNIDFKSFDNIQIEDAKLPYWG